MADTYRPYVAELADKRGYIHPIHAKQLAEERTVTMTGDVTGTANWDFGEPASASQASESMALTIGEQKVTTEKLADGAATTPKVADNAVTLAKIDDNAMNGTVQDNDSKLATHAAVKTYVDAQISGQGTYLGKKTVAEVNAMTVNNLHNGDRVQMADAGTINLGPGGVGFDVVAGEDLILYKSGSTVQWDTMDGNFKTKQSPVSDPAADGTTITAIDTISQNANGEITATKKTIRTGNGSNTGVVKLSDSTSSTSGVRGGVAATPAAVKAAYDLASGKKDKQAAIDTDTSSGSGKGGTTRTLTRLQQDANGVITPTFADIPTASAQTKGLMGTAEYTKLSGIAEGATKTEASSTNGNIKIDGTETTVYSHPTQTAYTGKPTADAAPAFGGTFTVSQVTTNGTGHVTGLTDRTITIPSATATTSSNGLMSSSDKSKLDGIAEGAEVNQNAFSNVKVGNATIEADSKTDTLEIAGGTGIDAVGDTANDKVTLSLDSATQTSLGKADSAVQGVKVNNTTLTPDANKVVTVPLATTSADGAMSAADKTKLNNAATYTQSSGTAPVKVDAYGALTAVPMDSTPTASSTNLMTSGAIKTALDNAVANNNKRYPFGVRQNRTTSYGYRLFNVKFSTAQSANSVRISGNIVVGTTGDNEHISFDLVIANVNTVENNPSEINLITTSTRRGSRVVRLAYKRPSNWTDGLDVFILWNAEGTATATNDTYGWEITQQEATLSSGVEVKDENLTSALTGFTLDTPRTAAITEGTSAIGSTSVPVYANENGVITPCTDDFVHDGDVAQTYSSSSTAPISGHGVKAAVDSLSSTQIPIGLKYDMVLANETSTTPTLCYEISNIGLTSNYSAATAELVVYQYAALGTSYTNIPSYKVVVHWDRASAICIVEGLNPTGTWTAVVENSTTPSSTDVTTLKLYFKPAQYRTYRMSVVSCKLRGASRESYITDGTIVVKKVTQEIPTASTLVIVGTTTVKTLICDKNVTSTYSATGTDPVNGTAVASAISTKQDSLTFMDDTEATSLWQSAWAAAN